MAGSLIPWRNTKTNVTRVVLASLLLLVIVMFHIAKDNGMQPTEFNSSVKIMLGTVLFQAGGNLKERVQQYNAFLCNIRAREFSKHLSTAWNKTEENISIVFGTDDNYVEVLSRQTHVRTFALPWIASPGTSNNTWNLVPQPSSLLIQTYYEWTGDDRLCTWIETKGAMRHMCDVVYNRTCNRNVNDTSKPRSLAPIFLNVKPLRKGWYWPNDGQSYPSHFYTEPPSFVSYLHVYTNAVVTNVGDVFCKTLKVVLFGCSRDENPVPPFRDNFDKLPLYDELFVIAQYWGTSLFHRMVEIVPRLAIHLDFLKSNHDIRIVAPEGPGGRTGQLVEILGLNQSRLVTGPVRGKVVYQPRSTACGFANVEESQILAAAYRDYIVRTMPYNARDKVLLIRRSRSRRFTEQKTIEEAVARAAKDYNLTYTLYADNPAPSLRDTMQMFHSAVVIVAPHGAGLTNILFSQPGTYVIEGVCNLPHTNLCFQRLAHVLGHHWHGITSRGGCEAVVDVATSTVHDTLRQYLQLWYSSKSK